MRRLLALTLSLLAALSCSPGPDISAGLDAALRGEAPGDICGPLMAAPASLPAVPVTGKVRFLAFGDFGTGKAPQRMVAAGMAEVHDRAPFHFGITLGDNFYEDGLSSPTHPRWRTDWEDVYGRLGIRFYAVLGNHDYHLEASPRAEMARSRLSASWCLPRPYYTFTAGPVQLFAVDTDPMAKRRSSVPEQTAWLDGALAASQAPWKVVYGHHPVYTNGEHGGSAGVLPAVRDALLPVLRKHKVNVYLAGHDHDLQALAPEQGIRFLVSGGGGRRVRPLASGRCREWAASRHGFTVVEADEEALTATFFNEDGKRLHQVKVKKGERGEECVR